MNLTLTGVIPLIASATPDLSVIYTLDDVPFPPSADPKKAPMGLRAPHGGLTLIHGQRVGMVALSQVRALLAASGYRLIPVSVEMAGNLGSQAHYRDTDLPHVRMLNLDYINAPLRDRIVDLFVRYTQEEGMPFPIPAKPRAHEIMEIVMYRPHLIARLHDEPDFAHLDVICYPVATAGKPTRRATVFSRKAIQSIRSPFFTGMKIELPSRLK